MRAFLCEVDHTGLRRFIPEGLIARDDQRRLVRNLLRCSTSLYWTLLAEDDAEVLRADVEAGRHHNACGLLLNRAVELIPLHAAVP